MTTSRPLSQALMRCKAPRFLSGRASILHMLGELVWDRPANWRFAHQCRVLSGVPTTAAVNRNYSTGAAAQAPAERAPASRLNPARSTTTPVRPDDAASTRTIEEAVTHLVDELLRTRRIRDRQVRLTVLAPPTETLVRLLCAALGHRAVAVALLPVEYSLLRSRLASEPVACYRKHVVDNWRSLIVEAGTDVLVTTRDYYPLLMDVVQELAIPAHVLTERPSVISGRDFEAAVRAGHGYLDVLNARGPGAAAQPAVPALADEGRDNAARLHVFSEIGSCNSKAAAHSAAALRAELDRAAGLFGFQGGDHVLNCLLPHDYACTVHGVLHPLRARAHVHCPLALAPLAEYTALKPQFPLTTPTAMHETLPLALAQSVFEYVRGCGCRPTVLMCDGDVFRSLLAFISHCDVSEAERRRYLAGWSAVDRIFVFTSASQLFDEPMAETAAAFLQATALRAAVTQVYTLAEVGVVARLALGMPGAGVITMPGCKIVDEGDRFTVTARTGSLFQAYLKRQRATASALAAGSLRLAFRKRADVTVLLDRHADYVTYFKRRRERMARYPQGYIKKVPVRTQFWGNFTGRRKHYSVL